MKLCPVCNTKLILEPEGPPSASVLVVGDSPNYRDFKARRVFAEHAANMLSSEFARVGIPFYGTRRMYLWGHDSPADRRPLATRLSPAEAEFDHWSKRLIVEMENRAGVLLMGTDPICTLMGVVESQSLWGLRLSSFFIPASTGVVVAAPSVNQNLQMGIGELRLAIHNLARLMKETA